MEPDSDQLFLKDLFKDLSRKVEESHVRLEGKVDGIRESLDHKLDTVEAKVLDHEKKIEKHDHYFTMAGSTLAGIPVLAGVISWFLGLFPGEHK